jgi:Pectate lyase superfamily protein
MALTKVSYSMITGAPVNVKDYGAVGDGVTNDAVAMQAAITAVATTGQAIYVPAGTYVIGSALTSTGHLNMVGDGDKSILDFSGATLAGSAITVTGALTQIQNISSASIYGATVTFASAPSLAIDDVFCIYDTDLWNTIRPYYYKGEWCQVKGVAGSDATITNPLYDSYTSATTTVYKLESKAVSFRNLRLVGGANTFGLLKLQFCEQAKLENVSVYNEDYQGVEFDRCYNSEVTNCYVYNKGTGTLDDYGLLFSNSQKFRVIGGDYYARRHGVTIGGGDYICAVTNRDMRVIGATISNDINSGVYSADMHGNMQDCYYQDCTIYNGAGWAGMDNGYDNCAITAQFNGSVIYGSEIKGGMLYVRNSKLLTAGDPTTNGRGIIDVGGNSSAINSATTQTLSLIVENCYIKAPLLSAGTDFMNVSNDGSTANVNIYIDGLRADVNAMGGVLRTNVISGAAYSQAIVVDNISNFPIGTSLHVPQGSYYINVPQRLMSQTGTLLMTATSGTAVTVSATQNYRYGYPRIPQAVVSVGSFTTGFTNSSGENIGATIFQIRELGIRLALVSTSNANWSNTINMTVNYIAELSEV